MYARARGEDPVIRSRHMILHTLFMPTPEVDMPDGSEFLCLSCSIVGSDVGAETTVKRDPKIGVEKWSENELQNLDNGTVPNHGFAVRFRYRKPLRKGAVFWPLFSVSF